MENATFLVASLFACNETLRVGVIEDPLIRETTVGCRVLKLMQEMYHFGIAYDIRGTDPNLTDTERRHQLYPKHNRSVDIYVRPMAFRTATLEKAFPIEAILTWRFGFLIRRPDFGLFQSFYSEPFSSDVWHCIIACLLLASALFYFLHRWDRRFYGGTDCECSFVYELLLAAGAVCQHYLPVDPKLVSRRTAYFSFFFFTFVMHTFYASNLLSHLVSDRDNTLDLDELAGSKYQAVVLENMKMVVVESTPLTSRNFLRKFKDIRTTNITTGLDDLESGNAAVLSDYLTLYPHIKHVFDEEAICQLLEVDLYKNIKKYFFTSKDFRFKEEFKIGILRAQETGVLRRLTGFNKPTSPICITKPQIRTQFVHILVPLTILGMTYVLSVILLAGEKICFERNRLFPYTN